MNYSELYTLSDRELAISADKHRPICLLFTSEQSLETWPEHSDHNGLLICHKLSELRQALDEQEVDLLVIEETVIEKTELLELLYLRKVLNYEPTIIVLLKTLDANSILEYYRAGAFRVIPQQGHWFEEYLQSLEQALRFRTMENENIRMHAKLTEANALLQEQNRRLDEFSTSVAHDIRAPLGSIMMRLEFLKDELGTTLKGRPEQVLQRAIDTSQRVIELVSGVYEFARMGKNTGIEEPIELSSFVTEILEDLRFEGHGNIQVHIGELPIVCGKRALLQRVFLNLITNSVKYRNKDEVVIHIQLASMQQRFQTNFAVLSFEDNGPGIPDEYHQTVFQMFSRGVHEFGEEAKSPQGLGIGLTAVKRIVEQHYGEIRIDSTYKEGLRILFSLPTAPVQLFR